MTLRTRFTVGELVQHTKFDDRGVIVGVDPVFAGSEEWYQAVARSRPPKNQPWYHVLVDGQVHSTYVAECHLDVDMSGGQIEHPDLGRFFDRFINCRYVRGTSSRTH